MKLYPYHLDYYESTEICEFVEQDCKFTNDLWFYWSSLFEINNGTITAVALDLLVEVLKEKQEHGLARNLENLLTKIDKDQSGVFVGYFW